MFVLNYSYKTNNGIVLNSNALNGFVTNNQNNNSHTGAPRAYLKYLLFDEDFKLVQGFAERIDNGAGTVHTYNTGGQLVVPKNGFIYVFTTNESPVDVWFDDVSVIHRTGPLLQESSFYPFGMEITPLSSYAAIKVPNERDYQKNELDEEFGLELHYFDARMYDAQVGRFGGVDEKAHEFMKLSPYNYAANNPLYFLDPDGRELITATLIFAGKFLFKKLAGKKAIAAVAKAKAKAAAKLKLTKVGANGVTQATKFGKFMKTQFRPLAAGTRNVINQRSGLGQGNFFQGLVHFAAGYAGAKVAMIGSDPGLMDDYFGLGDNWSSELGFEILGAATGGLGSMINNAFDGDNQDGISDWQAFARGAGAVISSKFDEKSFKKGFSSDIKKPKWFNYMNNSILGGANTIASKYGQDGQELIKKYGNGIFINLFFAGAASGAATTGLDHWMNGNDIGNGRMLLNVGLGSVSKDFMKAGILFTNSSYRKKNSFFSRQFLYDGMGLNLSANSLSWLIGFWGR